MIQDGGVVSITVAFLLSGKNKEWATNYDFVL
jgi:hypothetical protein